MTGQTPAPPTAQLGLYRHGDAVSETAALELAGRPDFSEDWVICPDANSEGLRLMWGDACSTEELERVVSWNDLTLAALKAERLPSGTA